MRVAQLSEASERLKSEPFLRSTDTSELDPFCNYLHLSWLEWIKVAIMSVTVAPIRLFVIIIIFGMVSFVSYIGCIFSTERTFQVNLSWWRKTCRYICRKLLRILFFFCGFHYLKVKGKRASRNETMILVMAPHSSFCDVIPALAGNTVSGISKIENQGIFGLGNMAKILQPIWVNREDSNSRQRTIELLIERVSSAGNTPQTAVFPEGTTTNRTCLINFKAGAFVPGAPLQPILISYPNRIDCITWTVKQRPLLLVAWILLCQFHNRCSVEYMPVYHPSDQEKKDAKFFANNVRALMAKALGVPVSDHRFNDGTLGRSDISKSQQQNISSQTKSLTQFSDKLINNDGMTDFTVRLR